MHHFFFFYKANLLNDSTVTTNATTCTASFWSLETMEHCHLTLMALLKLFTWTRWKYMLLTPIIHSFVTCECNSESGRSRLIAGRHDTPTKKRNLCWKSIFKASFSWGKNAKVSKVLFLDESSRLEMQQIFPPPKLA